MANGGSASGKSVAQYQLLDKIGEGGMGEVYAAKDSRLSRTVAVKVLPASAVADPARRQRFLQEARAASALNHPNIVTIHDILSEEQSEYMVMEFVQGKQLADLIPPEGLRPGHALKLALQIAGALGAAHAAGIVHRDLKPGNVMVSENGHVKLLDFGLAKLVYQSFADGDSSDSKATRTIMQAAQTTEGSVLGTVNYMSPEQAEGKPVDARSDIFTFGTVLYEMLSGKLPFKGGSPVATLTAILRDDPPPMTVDPGIQEIVFKCLRKDPAERWQTMRELQGALEAAKQNLDTGMITGVRPAVAAPPPAAKKSSLPLVLAGVGALLALASGAYFALNRKPVPAPPPLRVEQKPADPAVKDFDPADETLDNDSVIEMVQAGLSTNLIISQIRVAKTQFEFSPKEIIRLSKSGVPDVVLTVMRDPKAPLPAGVTLPKDPPASAKKADPKPDPALAAKKGNDAPPKPGAPEPPPPPVATAVPVNPEPVAAPVTGALKLAVIIPDGTRVRLSLAEAVQRAALEQKNFKIRFQVAEDIAVGDQVVIAKGSRALGTVFTAGQKRFLRMGGGPRSLLILETVDTVDGHQARLRSRVAGAPVPFDVSGLAQGRAKDDPVVVPQGTEIYAYVDGDLSVYGRKK